MTCSKWDYEPSDKELQILDVIKRIPKGRVATYGQVATLAGLPRRARLVGRVLRVSPLSNSVPWHRVVQSTGKIATRDDQCESIQAAKLEREGVEFDDRGRIDIARFGWMKRS